MYFDRTARYNRNIMMMPYPGSKDLTAEVKDLKRKIEELESKMNKRSSRY